MAVQIDVTTRGQLPNIDEYVRDKIGGLPGSRTSPFFTRGSG